MTTTTAAAATQAVASTPAMILVLGGTGKTGRRVAARLSGRPGVTVRIGSRAGTPPFDWDDESTWDAVLDGVGAVYLVYSPDLGIPGADEVVGAFARRAVRHGVTRLVLLSGRGEQGAERAEHAVREAGAEWTIVRCAWFAQAFSEDFLRDGVLEGTVVLPAGAVAEPFVDADDIAEVVVAALLDDGHAGRVRELTGPRALSFAEAAAVLSEVTGRPVRYEPVSPEDYVAVLTEHGLPAHEAEFLAGLFATVLDGRNTAVTDGVREVLGRPAVEFGEAMRRAAAAGAWERVTPGG
ncbi:NmrA family transcriptional regulator [Saccharomonospora piscinae]|uniref:NmrA family transcriptional regulator n=1 Tax=Saccharomonospora piscinae TaxID=687388 RepID=A0A1V9AD04_SACPI|nr:NmrA family NAD(P)-binding protein [Saccharomonospora piscinae]OQO95007.1 NmrA family transcriptional regulator [Saccharomonospora piscinae]